MAGMAGNVQPAFCHGVDLRTSIVHFLFSWRKKLSRSGIYVFRCHGTLLGRPDSAAVRAASKRTNLGWDFASIMDYVQGVGFRFRHRAAYFGTVLGSGLLWKRVKPWPPPDFRGLLSGNGFLLSVTNVTFLMTLDQPLWGERSLQLRFVSSCSRELRSIQCSTRRCGPWPHFVGGQPVCSLTAGVTKPPAR